MKVNISGDSALTIFESVRSLTQQGRLQPGDALPSVRELAEQLQVNRNTVSAAYQRLVKAGIAITQGRLGTRICPASEPGEQEGVSDTALFDLADGSPRKDWLPDLNQVAAQTPLQQYSYGEATFLPAFETLARRAFAPDCPADFALALSNGAIDALERLLAAHLVPGDKVVVEDPCYISSSNAIRLAGMQVVAAAVDECGMQADSLRSALEKGAGAVLITPRAHNPTGACLSLQRAQELQAVLADYPNVLVMLDDHFSLLAYSFYHSVIPKTTRHWALFRSVSKGFGPDLRVAVLAADPQTVERINSRLAPGMSWVSRVLQSLVHRCLVSDTVAQQLAAAKVNCAQRRQALILALKDVGIDVTYSEDGLNVWVPLQRGRGYSAADSQTVAYELSKKGWLVRPGRSFDIQQTSQALRVSVQKVDTDIAQRFAADLSAILQAS